CARSIRSTGRRPSTPVRPRCCASSRSAARAGLLPAWQATEGGGDGIGRDGRRSGRRGRGRRGPGRRATVGKAMTDPDGFYLQEPLRLDEQWRDAALLRRWIACTVDQDVRHAIEPELAEMGALATGRLHELALAHRREEPVHAPYERWGRRIDE